MTALLAAARALHFASLMTIFGATAYATLLRRSGFDEPDGRPMRMLLGVASVIALLTAIAWFAAIAGQMSGNWQDSLNPSVLVLAATSTRFGHIFSVRIAGLVLLCLLSGAARRPTQPTVPVLAGALLASAAPTSHAAANEGSLAFAGAASDAVHLLASGFWLGGLVALALLATRRPTEGARLIGPLGIFSGWGQAVVVLLVLSGVLNALLILPVAAMTPRNLYFDLLLLKVALALGMVGLAALNRWRLAPALLGGGGTSVRRLTSSIGLEIVLALTIVAIVGYLGTIAPH